MGVGAATFFSSTATEVYFTCLKYNILKYFLVNTNRFVQHYYRPVLGHFYLIKIPHAHVQPTVPRVSSTGHSLKRVFSGHFIRKE